MGISSRARPFCWSVLFMFFYFSIFCSAVNNITQGQSIRDGETITSAGQKFVLGFFSPGNTTNRYVGIWFDQIPVQSVVWVANRENPISGEGGVIKLEDNGNLLVLDGDGNSVWSSNTSTVSTTTTAILMDTGNLNLSSSDSTGDPNKAFWQSFDDPTDSYLPDMKVHMNVESGENRVFTSWKTASDPSPGQYSMGVDPRGPPQIVIWDGSNRHWRSGHWNGLIFSGIPTMKDTYLYGFKLVNEGEGKFYFTYTTSNSSYLVWFRIRSDGNEEQLWWDQGRNAWSSEELQPANACDVYNKCGSFGNCFATEYPICSCIKGFLPKDENQWNRANWTAGCVRRTDLQCGANSSANGEDGFVKIERVKLPDFAESMKAEDGDDCEEQCLKNCSCNAYAFVSGIDCLTWNGDLTDIQHFVEGGNDLYIRLANSELGKKSKISRLIIIVIAVLGTSFLCLFLWLIWRFRTKVKVTAGPTSRWKNHQSHATDARSSEFSTDFSGPDELGVEMHQGHVPELSVFNFRDIAAATDNFSDENKLGKGGFGIVYKGKLLCGEEIAVKRLSKQSGQGLEEFKNEIILIAKLQHRNLVRLLGYCTKGDERMLLYEYMPNKSLDSFLFDPTKQAQLHWTKRFTIIEGIARGLLYLHRDSRLRIIHRDLKVSNILLDEELNPKISDFGMAKIFGRNESEASTSRVVGTYGYMAPEYAMEGLFSMKSDVYSFGVLLLEIISGRGNRSLRSPEYSSIVGYAWGLWDSGKALELIDPSVAGSCCQNEALRCIHLAMLCVQDSADDRPTMSSILLMLESENATLPMPKEPTFVVMLKENQDVVSSNGVTISHVIGR